MAKRSLLTGVAYHGNRMPSHVRTDMVEIAKADMDIVVHMLSHTDWTRHKRVMKDIFASKGIRATVDFWGYDVDHDWPWWQKQLPYFLDKIL